MIDTKIACQCGNRFKFGMDLVNGRAPDGLICPTCGAPATPACNALVDFLSGRPAAPPGAGSRPVKEVKVTCACGARYKFDLELAEQEMPAPVVCPGCQADLTTQANEEIRSYVTRHAGELVGTAAQSTAPPAIAPAVAPAAAPTPAADPVLPPAARSTPAPSPAAAPAEPVPAAAPPATPAKPEATPVSDPFGPPPSGKSGGPNLKPLEVPKPNRPPPGSRPASPPAKPAAPAAAGAPKPGKPDPAKPAVVPAKVSREPNVGLGVAGAFVGALIGAALWFAVIKFTGRSGSFMALVVGGLSGLGARVLGRSTSTLLAGAACASTLLAIGVMVWLAMMLYIDNKQTPQLAIQYKSAMDRAQAIANAQTDAELRPFVVQSLPMAEASTAQVSEEQLKAFRNIEVPKARAILNDKDYRTKYEMMARRSFRSNYPLEDVWDETFGIFGLLFLLGGILGAAKLGMK